MIRPRQSREIVIDLDGPKGNAFELMGIAKGLAFRYGLPSWQIDDVITEMMSGDYNNLVKTFDKYFGSVVALETTNEELLDA